MSYKVQLKEVADVISGMSFSARNADPQGVVPVIQSAFIKPNKVLSEFKEMKKIAQLPIRSPAVVRDNDIVMMSRATPGSPFRASLVKTDNPLIASFSVYIIRPNNTNVLSEYLLHLINSRQFQVYVSKKTRGSTITHITKQSLCEMKIPIPSKKKQQILQILSKF